MKMKYRMIQRVGDRGGWLLDKGLRLHHSRQPDV